MCGLFGWQFDQRPEPATMGALAALLSYGNEERGAHSWGYATGFERGDVLKGTGALTAWVPAATLARHASIMVHTRYKTHGDVTVKNAHPFRRGHILGMHNGVIFNEWELCQEYGRDFAVDSMHIFEHMRHSLPLHDLEGYGTVTWIDQREPGVIFLCKLDDGELSIAKTAHGVVWSSSRDHLEPAMRCAGLKVNSWVKVKQGRVYRVEGGSLQRTGVRHRLSADRVHYRHWSSYESTVDTPVSMTAPTGYDARLDDLADRAMCLAGADDETLDAEAEYAADMDALLGDDAGLDEDERMALVEDIEASRAGRKVYKVQPIRPQVKDTRPTLAQLARDEAKRRDKSIAKLRKPIGFANAASGGGK